MVRKLKAMWSSYRKVPSDTRYLPFWFHSLLPGHFPLRDERPWVTFKAITWLKRYLKPDMQVFEYGSGGSTLFFARRVGRVVSVEHDEEYYRVVSKAIESKALRNCQYLLRRPKVLAREVGLGYSPRSCTSFMERWKALDFSGYVGAIDDFPDGSFDLVAVDGRSRVSCIARSLSKVKRGGWLLLDNSEREGYEPGRRLLANYRRYDFYGLVPSNLDPYQTSVWHLDDAPPARAILLDRAAAV